uniref:Myozenin 3 n=1 Tax=Buteo japonicus TaxID=224669 RepID=A0A8C0AZJ2_9AVES
MPPPTAWQHQWDPVASYRTAHKTKSEPAVTLWLCSPLASPVPRLDLGKKMSVAQDLMIEELSLPNNRGSLLFQQRQRRMQRFIFEHPSGYREVGLWLIPQLRAGQPFPSSLSLSELSLRAPRGSITPGRPHHLSPCAGYSGPLKEVPPEKFNVTAIPKGYRSPWQELLGDKDKAARGENKPPVRPFLWDFRSFNRTPTPFDKALVSDLSFVPAMELDNLSVLEVISHRRNFNRVPQGWVRILPESDEL